MGPPASSQPASGWLHPSCRKARSITRSATGSCSRGSGWHRAVVRRWAGVRLAAPGLRRRRVCRRIGIAAFRRPDRPCWRRPGLLPPSGCRRTATVRMAASTLPEDPTCDSEPRHSVRARAVAPSRRDCSPAPPLRVRPWRSPARRHWLSRPERYSPSIPASRPTICPTSARFPAPTGTSSMSCASRPGFRDPSGSAPSQARRPWSRWYSREPAIHRRYRSRPGTCRLVRRRSRSRDGPPARCTLWSRQTPGFRHRSVALTRSMPRACSSTRSSDRASNS